MAKRDIIKELGEIAVGSRLKRISDRINREISKIFREQNIDIEPSWLPLILFLKEQDAVAVREIAAAMNFTHPAVIHLLKQMEKKKLIETYQDENDKRKRLVRLNDYGKNVLNSASFLLDDIKSSLNEVFSATGYDFIFITDLLERELNDIALHKRAEEKIKKAKMDSVDILRYTPKYKGQFKSLNLEWLRKYFAVEPEDEKILSNPENIVDNGGEIFFASLKGSIIGTCAVIKISDEEYEMAKMAVTEKARGKQAGKKLALAAIGFAYSKGAGRLTLETNQKLTAAVCLYESLGFEYVQREQESKFKRTTVKMRLELK